MSRHKQLLRSPSAAPAAGGQRDRFLPSVRKISSCLFDIKINPNSGNCCENPSTIGGEEICCLCPIDDTLTLNFAGAIKDEAKLIGT